MPRTLFFVRNQARSVSRYSPCPARAARHVPKRRLPSSAYAFLSAAVFHRWSSKLLASRRSVAACSLFHDAMRHRPVRICFLCRAR